VISANRNFAVAYLLLVVIPILGLAGVLRSGSKLTAPIAIGGLWKMQVDSFGLAALPCAGSVIAMQDADFTISQSGKYFTLNFANSVMYSTSGSIEGTTIKVSMLTSPKGAKEAGCSGERVFSLIAALDSKANPNHLVGLLSVNDCAVCSPAEFRAVREK